VGRRARISISLAAVAAGFAWGWFAGRHGIFPGGLLRSVRSGGEVRIETPAPGPEPDFLRALPYVSGTYDPEADRAGVLVHERGRASPGTAFYNSEGESAAYEIDLDGKVLRSWRYDSEPWQLSRPLPDGGLLALVKDRRLLRLDRESNLVWEYEGRVHHALDVGEDGEIRVLSRRRVRDPALHPTLPCLLDTVVVLGPDGEERAEHSIVEMFRRSRYAFLLPSLGLRDFGAEPGDGTVLDVLHTNHLEVLDGRLADRWAPLARGNLLLCFKNLDAVAIAGGEPREIVWVWGPSDLVRPHAPALTEEGRILVFNNRTEEAGGSQVIELDPRAGRVVWAHSGFFSAMRGGVQRLPNGNTLIVESDRGYAFEVTPAGETVWRFANPDVDEHGIRRPIYRMLRTAPR